MGLPKICEICGTKHHSYQGHVFATNKVATNANATNGHELHRVEMVRGQFNGEPSDVPGGAVGAERVLPPTARQSKTANRRSRESYNAYQREYMRKRRSK